MQGSIPIQQVVYMILHFRGVCQVYFLPQYLSRLHPATEKDGDLTEEC